MKHAQGRAPAGTGGIRGKGNTDDFTRPARIINLPTRRAVWLRLVATTRDAQTEALLRQHRTNWTAYLARRAA